MSGFNGSGVFSISGTGLPVVTGTTISSTVANTLNSDLATGLSTALCKDGQSTPTANIKMGGFKFTNLGVGTSANDSVTYAQLNSASGTFTPIDSSGASLSFTSPVGYYRTIGNIVHVWGSYTMPSTADTNAAAMGGLPFTSANLTTHLQTFQAIVTYGGGSGLPGSASVVTAGVRKNSTILEFRYNGGLAFTNANLSTSNVDFSATYPI